MALNERCSGKQFFCLRIQFILFFLFLSTIYLFLFFYFLFFTSIVRYFLRDCSRDDRNTTRPGTRSLLTLFLNSLLFRPGGLT